MNMPRENIINNYIFLNLIKLIVFIFIATFTIPDYIIAGYLNWIQVNTFKYGQQWWANNSIRRIYAENIQALRFFTTTIKNKQQKDTSIIYLMDIDYSNGIFRYPYRNGMPQSRTNWVSSKVDELINSLIKQTCPSNII